jgi:hypothetical protein
MLCLREKSSAKWRPLKSWPRLQIRITQLACERSAPPGLRLLQAKLSRNPNRIAPERIRRFESYMPSQAVVSNSGAHQIGLPVDAGLGWRAGSWSRPASVGRSWRERCQQADVPFAPGLHALRCPRRKRFDRERYRRSIPGPWAIAVSRASRLAGFIAGFAEGACTMAPSRRRSLESSMLCPTISLDSRAPLLRA